MCKRALPLLFSSCFFLILWEWGAHAFSHLKFVLPPPSGIWTTLWEMKARFWFHSSVTLKEMCGGFALALLAAFPLAWAMMRFHTTRSVLQPLFLLIQCIPMFALAPIMVVWFGWGYTAIVIPTALMIFFPLTMNIYQGLKSVPQDLLDFFATNQATGWQTFWKLRFPWALPHIFSGFRISAAFAGMGAIAGEWAGAQNGLGMLMLESRRNTDFEVTFGAMACLAFMSALLYLLTVGVEKISLPPRFWQLKRQKSNWMPSAKRARRAVFPLFLALFCWIFLSACSSQKKSEEGRETEDVRLMLDWLPNPNHVPLYAGLSKGFFAEEGISLSIQKMHEGGGGISYLIAHKTDLLVNHMPGTLKAAAHDVNLKVMGLLIKEPLSGLTYRADLGVEKTEDLSGKKLGYCIGESDTSFLDFLLNRGGITPLEKKNISVDLISAVGTGSVDFIFGAFWNIEPAQFHALGIETKSFTIQELGIPCYYEMIILAEGNSTYACPDFTARFQRALQKSLDFCRTYPIEAFTCYLSFHPDYRKKTIDWQQEAWQITFPLMAQSQEVDPELVAYFYEWEKEHGILKEAVDLPALFSLLPQKTRS